MHARNRSSGNGYRSNSMVAGGFAAPSRISPESSMRGQGGYRSDYRTFNRGGYGRGQSRQFQRPPQQKNGDIFMEAGRLATEYLISKGVLPPNVLSGKWQNDSLKNQVSADSMQLPLEGRTSALSRLGGPVTDVAPGRRRYQDDYNNSSSSNYLGSRRRSGSFKNYNSDSSRELGRSESLSERLRASVGTEGGKDNTFSSHQNKQQVCKESNSVPQDPPESAPKSNNGGILACTLDKHELGDRAGVNASSGNTEEDLSMLADVKPLEKPGTGVQHSEAGEIKEAMDCDAVEQPDSKDDSARMGDGKMDKKMDNVLGDSSCDLLKLCSFAKVPTKTRSSMAFRGSKVEADVMTISTNTLETGPLKESGSCVKDLPRNSLPGNNSSILEIDKVEEASREDDELEIKRNNFNDNSPTSIPEVDEPSPKEQITNEEHPESVTVSSITERGEKRSMNDESIKEDNKRPRESAPTENSQSDVCLCLSDSREKQSTLQESIVLESGAVHLPSDEKRLLDVSLYFKGDIEPCLVYKEEKQLFPGSFKTCDLNLMEASDLNENHEKNSVILFPSIAESGKRPMPVDFDLTMTNNSHVSIGECSIVSKDIEVIDLDNEPDQEDRDVNNSERRNDNAFTCLDGYSNNTHNVDISDVNDGYGLMISELLGNDIPSCPVPTDMNSLHGDMELHNSEGILGDDDSIYMSLGEIPISGLIWW